MRRMSCPGSIARCMSTANNCWTRPKRSSAGQKVPPRAGSANDPAGRRQYQNLAPGRGAGFSLQRDFSPAFSITSRLGLWRGQCRILFPISLTSLHQRLVKTRRAVGEACPLVDAGGEPSDFCAIQLCRAQQDVFEPVWVHRHQGGSCGEYAAFLATSGWDFCTGLGSPRGYFGK